MAKKRKSKQKENSREEILKIFRGKVLIKLGDKIFWKNE